MYDTIEDKRRREGTERSSGCMQGAGLAEDMCPCCAVPTALSRTLK